MFVESDTIACSDWFKAMIISDDCTLFANGYWLLAHELCRCLYDKLILDCFVIPQNSQGIGTFFSTTSVDHHFVLIKHSCFELASMVVPFKVTLLALVAMGKSFAEY